MLFIKKFQRLPKTRRCNYGSDVTKCISCNTHRAIIRKFKMNICRRCFREKARQMGFEKF